MSYRKTVGGACRIAVVSLLILVASATAALAATNGGLGSKDLAQGMSGAAVKALQKDLTVAGDKIAVSGQFGHNTMLAVKKFQRAHKLSVDGVVGPQTRTTLLAAVEKRDGADPTEKTAASTAGSTGTTSDTTDPTSGATAPPSDDDGGASIVPPAQDSPVVKWTLVSGVPVATSSGTPQAIVNIIDAADSIAFKRYVYGGGHSDYSTGSNGLTALSSGYDCSGSVSFALHADGASTSMLKEPLDSTQFQNWGQKGKGRWITVYATDGHAYAEIAGIRFDTVAQQQSESKLHPFGDRWTTDNLGTDGFAAGAFVARHPAGW